MPPKIWFCKCEKAFREKFPIALNNVLDLYWQSRYDLQHKGNSVILQVQTAHLGIVANPKQAGTPFGKKTAQNLNRIKNKYLALITTLLAIYR